MYSLRDKMAFIVGRIMYDWFQIRNVGCRYDTGFYINNFSEYTDVMGLNI